MPRTEIHFFQDDGGRAPVRDWLQRLRFSDPRALAKCNARLRLLEELGFEIRRPYSDYLRDGLHELRVRAGRQQLRILYFYHGKNSVVLAHAVTKERRFTESDFQRALIRLRAHEANPKRHTSPERWTDG